MSHAIRNGPVDFAIVTALKVERDAVLRRLQPAETVQDEGDPHTYYLARLAIPSGGHYTVLLTRLLEPGNYSAAASTAQLIQRWRPRHVLVVGIAGGVADRVALGDVAVAEYCFAYEQTKPTPGGDEPREQQLAADKLLLGRAQAYQDNRWKETIGVTPPSGPPGYAPEVHFGPIASGEKVIADPESKSRLKQRVPKLLATEMEGAGVATAISRSRSRPAPGFFEIRGISDFADAQKTDEWHAYAANAAAAFALGFLRSGPVPPADEAAAANRIGRYELTREIGQGGMGTVYLARDPSLDRQVAVKVLPRQFTHDPQFRARFQREAQIIAALRHPAIVPVFDYGEQADQPYIVMPHMAGGTLAGRLAEGRRPPAEVVAVIQRLAEALDAAHQQNVIHRDVKPSNVLFSEQGDASLSDFGLAKLLTLTPAATDSRVVAGTPTYMSPEQAQGARALDPRTDVYSLGVILYEMLVGQPPYQAETPTAVMLKHISEPVPAIDTARLGLPAGTNAVIARALAKAPEARYASAGDLARAVSALWPAASPAAAPPAAAKPPTTSEFIRDWIAQPAETPPPPPPIPVSVGQLHLVGAGPFLMGSRYHIREAPPRTEYLPDFEMAEYPVLVSQYTAFVDSGGYQQERWWGEAGWGWRQGRAVLWGRAERGRPEDWVNQSPRPTYPVTGVTWFEAEAYCRWLGAQKNRVIRLATEEEWEKAARGVDGRAWPWGDAFSARRANTYEHGKVDTLPAGHVTEDVSPYRLRDMGGNVQEWTSGVYRPLPDEEMPAAEQRVARGGSWNDTAFGARASFRHVYPPGYYFPFLGFRIVVERL